jgi:lipoprotein-releasing system permease protein
MPQPSLPGFIARKLQFSGSDSFSATAIKVARVSVALATAILIISVLIYSGYKEEIYKRMFSVGGQITVRQFTTGTLYEEQAQSRKDPDIEKLRKLPFVKHIQSFALKPALISTEGEVAGIILKGIGSDFNQQAFKPNFVQAPVNPFPQEGEIWISQKIARQLRLQTGKEVVLFFMQEPPRYRKVKITALYQTGLEQMDDNLAFVPQNLVQEMNEWTPEQVGGFEIFISDFSNFDPILNSILSRLPYNLGAEPITQTQAQMFEWLDVIGRNVLIMFILVSIVAGFNMAATLLILVMERRKMIGILKAMGARNQLIRKVFIFNGLQTMGKGMLFGNLLALLFCGLQYQFHLIPLDPENYYLSFVPISWSWLGILGINLGIFILAWLVLLLPVRMVNRIEPAEAVRAV